MQHHSHAPRPPHMRGHHIHQTSLAPPLHATGGAPAPRLTMNLMTSQQQNTAPNPTHQQQPPYHITSGHALTLPSAKPQHQQHLQSKSPYLARQQHTRLSHYHQQQHHLVQAQQKPIHQINAQTIQTNSQMQKIRQQHQLINNSKNVNSNNNTHQHQQQMGVQHQQQRNIHHATHINPHTQQNQSTTGNISKQQALTSSSAVGTQQHGYSGGANKTKYNSSAVAATDVPDVAVPKSILQNPNRAAKNKQIPIAGVATAVKLGTVSATTTKVAIVPKSTISVAPTTEAAVDTTLVATVAPTKTETTKVGSDAAAECTHVDVEPAEDDNTPNEDVHLTNDCDELPSNNVISCAESHTGSNSKEKTPMCLVNELARFNKITHQYRLTSENGPAHLKRFTVTLKLGDEEYTAEGFKIKKAQHLAAAEAIENTKYKHPAPKIQRRLEDGSSRATITPTVELNALAMKLGQQTYYLFDPRQQPPIDAAMQPPPDMVYAGMPHPPPHGAPLMPPRHLLDSNPYMRRNGVAYNNQRYNNRAFPHPAKFNMHQRYPLIPPVMHNGGGMPPHHPHHPHGPYAPPAIPCKITLIVGKQKFIGNGRTLQAAKHDAAARALQVLKTQAANKLSDELNQSIEESDSKSPISLVHEIGIKRNMSVHFKVLREEGPAHMKNFITVCKVGSIVCEGEGNGKKISKKRAAEKMLEELKQLAPLSPTKSPLKRIKVKLPGKSAGTPQAVDGRTVSERKKRTGGASIKEKCEADLADADNPISKLIVLLQGRKEKEPVYELISKNGNENTRRREFVMEASAAGLMRNGKGNNKKVAKRNAAQNLLDAICGETPTAAVSALINETESGCTVETADKDIAKQVPDTNKPKQIEDSVLPENKLDSRVLPSVSTTAGQVPGILILRQNKKVAGAVKTSKNHVILPAAARCSPELAADAPKPKPEATVSSQSEKLTDSANCNSDNNSNSLTLSSTSSNANTPSAGTDLRMKNKLLYLAKLLGFEVDFSDYPKGNHNEYLTIVTLSTTPAQICHGTGANSEESQNDAAKNALKILSDLGLNNVTSK